MQWCVSFLFIKKKSDAHSCITLLFTLVGTTGFEPATFWTQIRRDTKLRYVPSNGALDKIRTHDPHIRSVVLYPTELLAHLILPHLNWLLEVPDGLEPPMIELQSIALPTWLWNHYCSVVYSITMESFYQDRFYKYLDFFLCAAKWRKAIISKTDYYHLFAPFQILKIWLW